MPGTICQGLWTTGPGTSNIQGPQGLIRLERNHSLCWNDQCWTRNTVDQLRIRSVPDPAQDPWPPICSPGPTRLLQRIAVLIDSCQAQLWIFLHRSIQKFQDHSYHGWSCALDMAKSRSNRCWICLQARTTKQSQHFFAIKHNQTMSFGVDFWFVFHRGMRRRWPEGSMQGRGGHRYFLDIFLQFGSCVTLCQCD